MRHQGENDGNGGGADSLSDKSCHAQHPACTAASVGGGGRYERKVVGRLEQAESNSAQHNAPSYFKTSGMCRQEVEEQESAGKKQHANCPEETGMDFFDKSACNSI